MVVSSRLYVAVLAGTRCLMLSRGFPFSILVFSFWLVMTSASFIFITIQECIIICQGALGWYRIYAKERGPFIEFMYFSSFIEFMTILLFIVSLGLVLFLLLQYYGRSMMVFNGRANIDLLKGSLMETDCGIFKSLGVCWLICSFSRAQQAKCVSGSNKPCEFKLLVDLLKKFIKDVSLLNLHFEVLDYFILFHPVFCQHFFC